MVIAKASQDFSASIQTAAQKLPEQTRGSYGETNMASENQVLVLGSDSWTGAGDYAPSDDESDDTNDVNRLFYQRATSFVGQVNWEALAALSSGLRGSVTCKVRENYSIGHFNMVRRLDFADGVSWVARLRMPELKAVFGEGDALDAIEAMKVEIASMKFYK
jgi:hypothetical protein